MVIENWIVALPVINALNGAGICRKFEAELKKLNPQV